MVVVSAPGEGDDGVLEESAAVVTGSEEGGVPVAEVLGLIGGVSVDETSVSLARFSCWTRN